MEAGAELQGLLVELGDHLGGGDMEDLPQHLPLGAAGGVVEEAPSRLAVVHNGRGDFGVRGHLSFDP